MIVFLFFFFKQKTAYEMRISDWSSDVCSSDLYYATKAFVLSFSEALHEEMKPHNIRVTALCPGPTRTEFADIANVNDSNLFHRFASPPERVVRDGLKALDAGCAVAVSGMTNKLMAGAKIGRAHV